IMNTRLVPTNSNIGEIEHPSKATIRFFTMAGWIKINGLDIPVTVFRILGRATKTSLKIANQFITVGLIRVSFGTHCHDPIIGSKPSLVVGKTGFFEKPHQLPPCKD
ncbi:MAG: hypothetical protein Q7S98_03435, partial [Deltaproteobacteria bacterium]|nr:hypothetical protein [Deltaproteobacteria bacterium]